MKKRIIVFFLFGFACHWLPAQTISGTIYDAATRETIPGVTVYLNGTTTITTSDKKGRFSLSVGKIINTSLILSHLSYESLIIDNPFGNLTKEFYLTEKISTITEAMVMADRFSRGFSRDEKMKVFKDHFLGTSLAAKSCIIENEDDIELSYDYENYRLLGHTAQPVVVVNNYLAYRIIFDLHYFCVTFPDLTIDGGRVVRTSFFGTSVYEDQSPYKVLYAKRREEAYLVSIQYFWKNFIDNTLKESQFKIYNKYKQINQDQYFTILYDPPQKKLFLIPNTDLNSRHENVEDENMMGVIGVVFKNYRSEIIFLTNEVSVDAFGNPDPVVDKLLYIGDMGIQRLGDMLPKDYTFAPKRRAK